LVFFPIIAVFVGFCVKLAFIPTKYLLSWQTTVENSSGPILSEPEKLNERFQKVLGRPEYALRFVQELANEIPELKTFLEKNPGGAKHLSNSLSNSSRLSQPFVKVISNSSAQDFTIDFFAELSLPAQESMKKVTKAINLIVDLNNQGVAANEEYQMKELKETIYRLQSDSSQEIGAENRDFFREQSLVWQQCTRLETRLFRLAEQKGLLGSSRGILFRAGGSQSGLSQDSTGFGSDSATLTSYRLLALLEDEGKIKSEESKSVREELIDLDRRLEMIRKDKMREQSLSQNVLKGVLENFQKSASTVSTRQQLLPKLRISEVETSDTGKMSDSNRSAAMSDYKWLGISLLSGILVGFCVGAVQVFWSSNKMKLKEIVGGF
jgi:hypothetical protein